MTGGYTMKEINRSIFIFAVLVLMLSGCSTHQPMMSQEMYSAPNFAELMPENITVVRYELNPLLDISDTAFYPDYGFEPSTTWPFYFLPSGETDMKKAKRVLGVRFDLQPKPVILIYFPQKLEEIKDSLLFMTDHAGKRVVSSSGQLIFLPDWQSMSSEEINKFVDSIGEMNTIEATRGSQAYKDLVTLLNPFLYQAEKNWLKASSIRDDYYRDSGIKVGSKLTEKQLKFITKDESFKAKIVSFLGENWYGVITFPLWTPEQYGMSVLLTKVFQIPTKFWSYDFDKPGYMDRKLTALQGGSMIEYHDKHYGFKSMFSPEDVKILQELVKQLKQK